MHQVLRYLYEFHQADRQGKWHSGIGERDRQRRSAWLASWRAMLLHHSDNLSDNWRAHALAKQGAALGHISCRWLATAYDRWLVSQGQPQKYGTRSRTIDPTTTDAERAEWNVRSLAELRPDEPSGIHPAGSPWPPANG